MPTMHPNVASFRIEGGRITKLTPAVAVTVCELLGYLRGCGVVAKYADENFNGYLCDGKRVNLGMLLHLANRHRASHKLPPPTIRHLL